MDQGMDLATQKQVSVVIRYFTTLLKKVVSTFLWLLMLKGQCTQQIAGGLVYFFTSVGLDFANCIEIGTGGSNVIVGTNNSVFKHLWLVMRQASKS